MVRSSSRRVDGLVRGSKLTKSEQMSRIRRSETGPELSLRRALWRRGARYRLRSSLPGTPDLIFVNARIAIFVDGCFWHGCPRHYTAPRTNADFWQRKIATNCARDRRVDDELRAAGWRPVRIWEHEIKVDVDRAVDSVFAAVHGANVGVHSSNLADAIVVRK